MERKNKNTKKDKTNNKNNIKKTYANKKKKKTRTNYPKKNNQKKGETEQISMPMEMIQWKRKGEQNTQ